ncbi:PH domain-containing protein [Desmospora profundinema]|uniref:Membrane protein YdbS with pleckstrin-like domain n=1 Tax=Desmospora profundinema TaxID=1571184 RepID=A0ABU1IR47_9BACL|nr:PH domain-containing protein [Desmospora profundinema]MDR6226629.1 membrane protein YdbS with pleckstrin-like domain [Desmospora profundinema]
MNEPPKNRIHRDAIRVWRTHECLTAGFVLLVVGGVTGLTFLFDWHRWIPAVLWSVATVYLVPAIWIYPLLRWRYYRYEVNEKEIDIQSGYFFIRRTIIPMVRVQHVNTTQGPLLRRHGLSELEINTAGGASFTIPALLTEEADQLRDRIGSLVRVARDE